MPEKKSTKKSSSSWETCSICQTIPNSVGEFWKGGECDRLFPVAVSKLEVLGKPYFSDSTSSSNRCYKRCPECNTNYRWETEYEYLVNGSEDDITLTRLTEEQGNEALQMVRKEVQKARQQYMDEAQQHIKVLQKHTNQSLMQNAMNFFFHHQLVYEEDISFAISAILEALIYHVHHPPKCELGQNIIWVLQRFVQNAPEKKKQILRDLLQFNSAQNPPELEKLRDLCKIE